MPTRFIAMCATLVCLFAVSLLPAEELNVYSARHYGGDADLYGAFTKATGIKVNVIEDKGDKLLARIRAEGSNSPVDVLITVDAGRLAAADAAGLFAPVESEVLTSRIPSRLRHPEGHWFGFGQRLRILFYAPDRVKPEQLSTFADLADAKWKGKIVVRSSSNIYNQSLMADLIYRYGADNAAAWAKGVVANMARKPEGNDRAQIKAVAAGLADIAIANHYYWFAMLDSGDPEQVEAAKKVKAFVPDQGDGEFGAHVNVSGAGVLKTAPNAEAAKKFLEFIASDEGQRLFTLPSYEFPAVDSVKSKYDLPAFRPGTVDAATMGKLNIEAVMNYDRAGWR